MELTVQLLVAERVTVLGKVLTPAAPQQQYPLGVLEHARTYEKYSDFVSFGSLDLLLDRGKVAIFIPPSVRITTSAQLRAMVFDGSIAAQRPDGTPLGYRPVLSFSSAFSVVEDPAQNALTLDVVGGGGVTFDAPVATGTANAEGTSTSATRADHVHRTQVTVQENGVDKGARPRLDFKGAVVVADDPIGDKVEISIVGGGGGVSGRRMQSMSATDWAGGVKVLDLPLPANVTIQRVCLEVTEAFDGAARVRVGDDAVNDRLMHEYDSDLAEVGNTYELGSNYTYAGATQLKLYFFGAPLVGAATVFVYFAGG
jgi:hypothetical protein